MTSPALALARVLREHDRPRMEMTMRMQSYRLTVIGCVLAWFLVGLHLPVLHEITHHGRAPRWEVLAVTLLLAGAAVAGLWVLLRTPTQPTNGSGPHAGAA